MFKNIFLKTIYEKRYYTLFWFVLMFVMVFITMMVFPSFSQAGGISEALSNVPEVLKGMIGDLAAQKTINGYIDQQIFAFRMPLFMIIFSIILFNSLLVGDENDGTLKNLLATPISRTRILISKASAGIILTAVASLATTLGILFGLLFINDSTEIVNLLLATANLWILSICFGLFTLLIGAATGHKSLSSGIASLVAFLNYFITSLAPSVKSVQPIEKLTFVYYYNQPQVMIKGFNYLYLAGFLSFVMVCIILSYIAFNRRDIRVS